MRVATLMTMLAVPLALSACDSSEEAMDTEDMPMTGSGAEMRMASAEGTVTAIDEDAGTITIDHGPVPAVDWPAMNMAFEADEASMQKVGVGDEVTFDFQMSESGSRITSIEEK